MLAFLAVLTLLCIFGGAGLALGAAVMVLLDAPTTNAEFAVVGWGFILLGSLIAMIGSRMRKTEQTQEKD